VNEVAEIGNLRMKTKLKFALYPLVTMLCVALAFSALSQPKSKSQIAESSQANVLPLEFGRKLLLSLQSHPVEWRSNTYRLVSLGSIRFELDRETGRLKADVQGSTTSFDDVNYDVSAAVFNASGTLLGTARSECKVQRVWLGNVLTTQITLTLDFGSSLDYASAAGYAVNINRRKVLTPDEWQGK
jgi:hypothetical protein